MTVKKIDLAAMGRRAKEASQALATVSTEKKNTAIAAIAANLIRNGEKILTNNALDIEDAKKQGLEPAMLDRLSLDGRLEGIAEDIGRIAYLADPIGKVIEERTLGNGLVLTKRATPIGVLGIIYESRPNVTLDVAALTIKSSNSAILRGGSESLHTNLALMEVVHTSLEEAALPKTTIQFIDSTDRSIVQELLLRYHDIDLIIPRGGAGLHKFCRENSKIPVITGGIGICHLFVDATADTNRALEVIHNAKTQRPTVCNALDTLLVHQDIAEMFIPKLIQKLEKSGVSFRLDPAAMQYVQNVQTSAQQAKEGDWDTEWLSLILGIKVVKSCNEAIAHIQKHSSGHSDGILTANAENEKTFVDRIDSSSVYVNASTRFTDGGQFGLGAEVAISTQKLHARGPMGLKELTSYKWIIHGDYHVRN